MLTLKVRPVPGDQQIYIPYKTHEIIERFNNSWSLCEYDKETIILKNYPQVCRDGFLVYTHNSFSNYYCCVYKKPNAKTE